MRLTGLVLTIVVGLIVTVDCMAITNDAHEIDTSMEYAPNLRRELDERSTESEEHGRRGGGRDVLTRFKSWFKRVFGKKQ
ncbi:hypothetical protein L915_02672 [Phytophthora nicotianae]|uniref:RxLR effector protein n=1 Tax=Phytophthora nicotianae TaxID=4792 RepID=W2HIB3_PHYNI|nr:hypothetical protein L915_02672 [Phytophthora nicotianae]ETL47619.1 hypothetical protein L916_02651 [Phytophthora nicotianae]ETM53891.1 hypothetical protein L914_02672 [Phytophthora nicotianae]